jgi:hypothetical protein
MLTLSNQHSDSASSISATCSEASNQRSVKLVDDSYSSVPAQIDFDLHGLVGIRLLDASARDAAMVARKLGPIQAPLPGEPDIVIRFVDRLQTTSPIRYLGLDDAGFTEDGFLVLRSQHGVRAKAQVALGQIGKGGCEIICESGLPLVPLLIPILNLTALSKGALPLHASAFNYEGTGVVTTGWSKGGKTETLLAFMARGATYVGDEWVYISADGQNMYGIPQPIRVWDWHLRQLPQYRARVGRSDLMRLRMIKTFETMGRATERNNHNGSSSISALDRLMSLLKRQRYVDLAPHDLFDGGCGSLSGKFDRLFFVVSHESADITVQPIDPREVARRMVFSLQYERLDFMSYYYKFRFAFPKAANEFIEQTEELQREMLIRMLAGKDTYVVYHPYPLPIPALFDAMSPLISR